MTDRNILDTFRAAGATAIRGGARNELVMLRMEQDGVVFRQMFEYPVTDFSAEVGFFTLVFGLSTLALTDEYALFAHPDGAYCLSFRKDDTLPSPSVIGLKLLFMTTDIDGTNAQLQRSGFVPDLAIREGTPVQRVIHFTTPAGVVIEIWECPSTAPRRM
jgi:predicted enzyme related to lactoylglutathione lyase